MASNIDEKLVVRAWVELKVQNLNLEQKTGELLVNCVLTVPFSFHKTDGKKMKYLVSSPSQSTLFICYEPSKHSDHFGSLLLMINVHECSVGTISIFINKNYGKDLFSEICSMSLKY
jgi:hypothetical protein